MTSLMQPIDTEIEEIEANAETELEVGQIIARNEVKDDRYAAVKRESIRQRLIAAFEEYKAGRESDQLWEAVMELAESKLRRLDRDDSLPEAYVTVDDAVQDAAVAVWASRKKFRGDTGDEFYNWVSRIVFIEGKKLLATKLTKRDRFTSLTILVDEDGEQVEVDNPEIYDGGSRKMTAREAAAIERSKGRQRKRIDRKDRFLPGEEPEGFAIPTGVSGLDRSICQLLKERIDRTPTKNSPEPYRGYSYAEIGSLLGISEKAVSNRIYRMRQRYGDGSHRIQIPCTVPAQMKPTTGVYEDHSSLTPEESREAIWRDFGRPHDGGPVELTPEETARLAASIRETPRTPYVPFRALRCPLCDAVKSASIAPGDFTLTCSACKRTCNAETALEAARLSA